MTPKIKYFLLMAVSLFITVFAGIMVKQSGNSDSKLTLLGWGFVFVMGALTMARGFRLYKRLP